MMRALAARLGASTAATLACACLAPATEAHVRISPATAAPGDAVRFELLVPGERDAHTIEVALKIPGGVLPFSYERTPGWHRQLQKAGDGSVAAVRWHGVLAADGFVRFAFLASTPARDGDLAWKVVQQYDDGAQAAWIGPPGSDAPAPITRVTAAAGRENSGGDGTSVGSQATKLDAAATRAAATADAGGDSGSTLALVLAAMGLVLGAAALAIALLRRPRQRSGRREAW